MPENTEAEAKIERVMATCHSIVAVQGKLLGDPLDIHMFNLTGRELKDGYSVKADDKLRVEKQFIFMPELQRMSVIARLPDSSLMFYLKGSPEKVA